MFQVHQRFVAEDVVEDYDAGLEFAEAAAILRIVQRGDQRQCLIRFDPPCLPFPCLPESSCCGADNTCSVDIHSQVMFMAPHL